MAFLWGMVIKQALLIASVSCAAALALFFRSSVHRADLAEVTAIRPPARSAESWRRCLVSLASSFVAIRRLRRIYFLEAFS
jgi:hypothetical protein